MAQITGPGLLLRAKLTVGPAGDHFEDEADRVADAVVRDIRRHGMAEIEPSESVAGPASVTDQRIQPAPRLDDRRPGAVCDRRISRAVQTSAAVGPDGGQLDDDSAGRIRRAQGGGSALDPTIRSAMEGSFGVDFSGVRVHHDRAANDLSESIQARAFTTGSDIFFRDGDYRPATADGQRLLAHELTHVVQQGARRPAEPRIHRAAVLTAPSPNAGLATQIRVERAPDLHLA